jgi:hypothetical protein
MVLSSTLYNVLYLTDRLQQAIQVTAEGFPRIWGHAPMFNNYALLRNRATQRPK